MRLWRRTPTVKSGMNTMPLSEDKHALSLFFSPDFIVSFLENSVVFAFLPLSLIVTPDIYGNSS